MMIHNLTAAYRDGQVFLTWDELDSTEGTTFNACMHDSPITAANLAAARKIGHHIEPHSATDWTVDATFRTKPSDKPPVGFVIESGKAPLDPSGGLFVHTVTAADEGSWYYAVTASDAAGNEDRQIVAGANATASPVVQRVAPIQPIWLGEGAPPAARSAAGKAIRFSLHGLNSDEDHRTGRSPRPNYVVFGDAKQGWREGLAHKFVLLAEPHALRIHPLDRAWVFRPLTEAADARYHLKAVPTFWYGHAERIYDASAQGSSAAVNYTEEHLLWLLSWARQHLGADGAAFMWGTSMGGSGAISMATRYPRLFAAIFAGVPVVAYEHGATMRLVNMCGKLERDSMTSEGLPLLERMNGTLQAQRSQADLPYMHLIHGRRDASIPWINNPPFYRALDATRQAYCAYWSNGDHGGTVPNSPKDVLGWFYGDANWQRLGRWASFPAFSNCSTNKNPGNGDPADGDIEGWMNRGMAWSDIVDEPDRYAISIAAAYEGITYPVTVDVTPRRVQAFRPTPLTAVAVTVEAEGAAPCPRQVIVDAQGLITIRGVRIPSDKAVRITITRST